MDSTYGPTFGNVKNEIGTNVDLSNRTAESVIVSSQTKLHDITLAQEDLSRARQDLLVERSKTRSAAEEVRFQRMVTGNMEGQFLSMLRGFYNSNSKKFPPAIEETYGRVKEERDRLGTIEDDYFNIERTLGGSEWRFMQKEMMLYQWQLPDLLAQLNAKSARHATNSLLRPPPPPDPVLLGDGVVLVHDPPPPPPPLSPHPVATRELREPPGTTSLLPSYPSKPEIEAQKIDNDYRMAVAELDSLRREFESLRPQQAELLDLESGLRKPHLNASFIRVRSQELFERYSDLLMKLSACEVRVQSLRQMRIEIPDISSNINGRMSDEWMLDCVKINAMERKLYANIREENGIPISQGNSLDESAEQYWFSQKNDSSSSTDGYVSRESFGQESRSLTPPASENNVCQQSDESSATRPATRPRSYPHSICDKETSFHHRSKSTSAISNPPKLKPHRQDLETLLLRIPC